MRLSDSLRHMTCVSTASPPLDLPVRAPRRSPPPFGGEQTAFPLLYIPGPSSRLSWMNGVLGTGFDWGKRWSMALFCRTLSWGTPEWCSRPPHLILIPSKDGKGVRSPLAFAEGLLWVCDAISCPLRCSKEDQ